MNSTELLQHNVPLSSLGIHGNLIASGNYRLDGENRAADGSELRPSEVETYPGHPNLTDIYLFGDHGLIRGKLLVPVNDAGSPLSVSKSTKAPMPARSN